MAVDVVPQLNERITASFQKYMMRDRDVAAITNRIRDGTATQKDGHRYSQRVGENLSRALTENITENTLPDGRLYYNIAMRTVVPRLRDNYDLVNEINAAIQEVIDKADKIGIGTVKPDFPEERIKGLVDKMTNEKNTFDDSTIWLKEPIVNNSEAFHDDFIRASSKCCDWCAALEGTYDYSTAPKEIYQRHEFCRCDVTYQTERKSQNVWSKASWASTQEEINKRINFPNY